MIVSVYLQTLITNLLVLYLCIFLHVTNTDMKSEQSNDKSFIFVTEESVVSCGNVILCRVV